MLSYQIIILYLFSGGLMSKKHSRRSEIRRRRQRREKRVKQRLNISINKAKDSKQQ